MWNDSLLREVVAPLYAVLIEKVKAIYFSGIPRSEKNCTDKPLDPIRLLALLPCPVPQDNSWQIVAACLFPLIKHQKVSYRKLVCLLSLILFYRSCGVEESKLSFL